MSSLKNSFFTYGFLFYAFSLCFFPQTANAEIKTVLIHDSSLPLTEVNLTFRVGSADDPAGEEGIASLTADLIREGGVKAWNGLPARSREELEEFFFPYAAEPGVSVNKEQTSFQISTSANDAKTALKVFVQMILAPAWDAGELDRLKTETLAFLKQRLPREDQEELGKAALDWAIHGPRHPYSHPVIGTIKAVESITLEKIQAFYKKNYTQKRLLLGATGVLPLSLLQSLKKDFAKLPIGTDTQTVIPTPPTPKGRRLTLVKGDFDATGVHLGHPLSFNRSSSIFPDASLGIMAFGKHRSFVGRLMSQVREIRGLNYGTYAYVEDFPGGGQRMTEPTQAARQIQAFTLWARPTPLHNGCFLLKQVVRATALLQEKGLSLEEFALASSHRIGGAPLLATNLDRRLGYAMDSVFYGIQTDYLKKIQKAAELTSRNGVNKNLASWLKPNQMEIVVVTPDPDQFKKEISRKSCSIQYAKGVTQSEAVLAEDKEIAEYPLGILPEQIHVIDAEKIFTGE